MRVLWVTDLFPHMGRPYKGGGFVDLAREISAHAEVLVLSPRYRFLWTPRGSFLQWYRGQPRRVDHGPVRAIYPASPASPLYFTMLLQSLSMAWSCLRVAREEHRRRPFDVVHGQHILPGGLAAALIAHYLSLPLVVTAHGADVNEFPRVGVLKRLIDGICSRAEGITAVSQDLVSRLKDLGFPGALWVPNACRFREERNLQRDRGRILFVGILYERKAPEILLDSFVSVRREIPGATLDIIGEGPEAARLKDQAARAGLAPAVRFLGSLPYDAVLDSMESADIFCLPSRREGFPLVALEAMAAGLPVVGTDIGGTREIVKRPELGTIVPPGDADALARALSSALRATWDRSLIRVEARKYNWGRIAGQYLEVYREAVASRRMRSRPSAIIGPE